MVFERSRRGVFALSLAAALALVAPAAAADAQPTPTAEQKETARNLMQIGDDKFAAGDHAGALEAYEGADAIMRVPSTGLAVGRARARLGMLVEAVDVLQRVARHPQSGSEPRAFAGAREEAKRLDADLARRIPTVKVVVKGPAEDTPVEVRIDGAAVPQNARELPRRVNPGKHVVSVSAPGYLTSELAVEVAEQQHEEVAITLEPGSAPPAAGVPDAGSSSRTQPVTSGPSPVMIAGFAIGGAGLAVGIATGAVSLAKTSELEERCGGTICPETERDEHHTIVTLANVSNVAFAVGGVGVAIGIVGLVLDLQNDEPSSTERARVRIEPVVGPGSIGLRGSF
jgi:hypothetical protein